LRKVKQNNPDDKRSHLLLQEDLDPHPKYERIIMCHIREQEEVA